jgi:hypothetical protein
MGKGITPSNKVLLRIGSSFLVKNLHDTRLELRNVGNVVGSDSVFSLDTRKDHRENVGAVVDGLMRETEIELDRSGGGSFRAEGSSRSAAKNR